MTLSLLTGCSASTEVTGVDGTWVGVGAEGAVYTSQDAVSWSRQESSSTADLVDVASTSGMLVAAGDWTVLMSVDGTTWREVTDAETANLRLKSVVFHDGKLYAGGNYVSAAPPPNDVDARVVRFDPDAETWVPIASPRGTHLNDMATDGAGLIAGYRIEAPETLQEIAAYDPTTESWSIEFTSNAHGIYAVSGGSSRYAVGGCQVLEADDDHWASTFIGAGCGLSKQAAIIQSTDGTAVSINGNGALRFDGSAWHVGELPPGQWHDITHRDGTFVIVGKNDEDAGLVAVSHDGGATWDPVATVPHALHAVTAFSN